MIALDAIVSLLGLVIPPAFDFIKKKFVKTGHDTPESTLGTLATTKPEQLAPFSEALAKLREADVKFFNRDVAGTPSQWVVDLRASIRPLVVSIGLVALTVAPFWGIVIDDGTRLFFEAAITSWFGSRLTQ